MASTDLERLIEQKGSIGGAYPTEIIIKPKDITDLAIEGEKFIFKQEAENQLIDLLMIKEFIDATIEDVKEKIAKAGKEISPSFKGVIGESVRCIYRAYGAKYKYDWKKKTQAEPFLKKKEYWSVDADAVDAYVAEVGELPEGIYEADREEKLSIMYDR